MKTEDPTPELLAPAGTIEAGFAAFDAGADAVYAGLERFNARERGRNFTFDELSRLLAFARRRGRRVYVTLNTLVKETELGAVADILARLAVIRPHAVIIQDLGVVRLVRDYFPVLPIHASTQMGIHNSAGVRLAERLGIQRVILERQVTHEEIEQIRKHTTIELEVFAHGALCCSRSGACLFSSWMGGWSGNRGKCKQPCRRRYFSASGNGFFFSTGDLYSLDAIPRLKTMGINGLKLEGRLRRADHVRRVVSAYRMMLDAEPGTEEAMLGRARGVLSGALGRKWMPAFRTEQDFQEVIREAALGASGQLCGRVTRTGKGQFEIEVSRPIVEGDLIRIQPDSGDEGPAVTVRRMTVEEYPARTARPGDRCWIHVEAEVTTGAKVFKLGGPAEDMGERVRSQPTARSCMDLEITCSRDALSVVADPGGHEWQSAVPFQAARTQALSADTIEREFRRSRSGRFAAGCVSVTLPEGLFLQASELKRIRRAFWDWADGTCAPEEVAARWRSEAARFRDDQAQRSRSDTPVVTTVIEGNGAAAADAIRAVSLEAWQGPDEEAVLPAFCPEGKLATLQAAIDGVCRDGVRRLRVTSLHALEMVRGKTDAALTAGFPLPVCNSLAMDELASLGVSRTMAWIELEQGAMKALVDRFGGAVEVLTHGRPPLLSTRFRIPVTGGITDGRGAEFRVEREDGLTVLYPGKALSIPAIPGASSCIDLSYAAAEEPETDTFNTFRELL